MKEPRNPHYHQQDYTLGNRYILSFVMPFTHRAPVSISEPNYLFTARPGMPLWLDQRMHVESFSSSIPSPREYAEELTHLCMHSFGAAVGASDPTPSLPCYSNPTPSLPSEILRKLIVGRASEAQHSGPSRTYENTSNEALSPHPRPRGRNLTTDRGCLIFDPCSADPRTLYKESFL